MKESIDISWSELYHLSTDRNVRVLIVGGRLRFGIGQRMTRNTKGKIFGPSCALASGVLGRCTVRARKQFVTFMTLVALLVCWEGTVFAEDAGLEPQPETGAELAQANKMRTAGIVLSSLGIASTVAGVSFMIIGAVSDANVDPDAMTMGGFFEYITGGVILGTAAVLLGLGIPFWVVGSSRRTRLMEATARLPLPTFAMSPDRSAAAFGLSWRF